MQWLEMLHLQVAENGQRAIAAQLRLSTTVISQVCNEKYPGDMQRIQALVESTYLNKAVNCPVQGVIPWHQCQINQKNQYTGNPQKLRLFKACRGGCEHSDLPVTQNIKLEPHTRSVNQAAKYDAEAVIGRLKLQISTDNGSTSMLAELLEEQLKALATRYNRLLEQQSTKQEEQS